MVNRNYSEQVGGCCSSSTSCCSSNEVKQSRVCPDGQRYVNKHLALPPKIAILSCEGACIKGEVSRLAANILAYQLERDASVRMCLGDTATGNSGMLELIKRAPEIIALEGCSLHCATEIVRLRDPSITTRIVDTSQLYKFDREKYFEIFDLPRNMIEEFSMNVAQVVRERFFGKSGATSIE